METIFNSFVLPLLPVILMFGVAIATLVYIFSNHKKPAGERTGRAIISGLSLVAALTVVVFVLGLAVAYYVITQAFRVL